MEDIVARMFENLADRLTRFFVPLVLLLAASSLRLGGQFLRRQRLSLPAWLAWSWAAVLVVAWAVKLCGDPG